MTDLIETLETVFLLYREMKETIRSSVPWVLMQIQTKTLSVLISRNRDLFNIAQVILMF